MTSDPPRYRPLERFWPYAELPEQPTDEELASLDPDLHEALFGAQPRPFSITLVFPALDVPDFARALELARGSAEFRETGTGAARRYRVRFWSSDAVEAARPVSDCRPLRRDRGPDRRPARAVRARALAAARVVPHPQVACRGRPQSIERDLQRLEVELKQLEAEYNMFFSGRLPKPPWETRSRVEALVKQYDRAHIPNYRRPLPLHSRCSRALRRSSICGIAACARARRAGPGRSRKQRGPKERREEGAGGSHSPRRVVPDPVREIDKLTELYESLAEARREVGEEALPFHKFADLVKSQVKKLQQSGSPEVAFRVAVKDGKVSFTARALKGATRDRDEGEG